jgi:patatin-like phospholipase/acyl hydrolase
MPLAESLGLRRRPFRILTLDGGGVRGIVPLIWMERLEEHLGGSLHAHVDLIAGTSVGAVMGCALSAGLTAEEIHGMWVGAAHTAFAKPANLKDHVRHLANLGGMAPKYLDTGLVQMLKSVFGDLRMGDLKRPTLALAYCPRALSVQVFSSLSEEHADLPVWEVCRASTAAPLFFSPHHMVIDESGEKTPLIDGGVTANNPVIVALSEALGRPDRVITLDNVIVASFGTGQPVEGKREVPRTIFGHTSVITQALIAGATGTDDLTARTMLPSRNYWRLQVTLPARLEPMDEAENVDDLIGLASAYLANGADQRLKQLARRMRGLPAVPGWLEQLATPGRESA